MKIYNLISLLLIIFFFMSCSKENLKKSVINQKSLDLQVLEAYNEGKKSLKEVMYCTQQKNLMKLKHYSLNLSGLQSQH